MFPLEAFQKLMLLLPLTLPTPAPTNSGASSEWSYEDINDWGTDFPTCDGYRQSPIQLMSSTSYYLPVPPIRFYNYDVPLTGPLTLVNNGHSVDVEIPVTRNGNRPAITGGKLFGRYNAIGVHFHWGSPNSEGSEHVINNRRYDAEMHIVHINERYSTLEEASQYRDGVAVFGVMIEMVRNPDRYYPGLNRIFNKLPQVVEYESETRINGPLSLGQLLGDVDTKQFFTYQGSLTTPPCSEAVTWTVFPDPLQISTVQFSRFFNIIDSEGEFLENNFRPLQNLNGRKVTFRYGNTVGGVIPIFLQAK